ncbi:MAG: Crp/Fnr family transcriptional regulator [Bacilli bacterium]|nr:Crp/Fnr family transcriptional regulator [Bacilli bacterium]MBN2877699.1 Crp/Fnr family transcriptional regulator [Bacilli bacterium]
MKQYCVNCIYQTLPGAIIQEQPNRILFMESEPLDRVYRIESGYVKMHRYLDSGDERILSVLGPGDYIALLAVLQGQDDYIAQATTLTDTSLKVIDKADILDAYQTNQTFQKTCLQCAVTRTHFFQFQISQSANSDTQDKILSVLLDLKKKFGEIYEGNDVLILPFSKSVLANLIGIRRETLSRHLSILQKQKKLLVRDNIYIIF